MVDHAKVKSHAERAKYEREALEGILDESLIGHLAFNQEDQVYNIPMLFARDDKSIIIHSSIKGRIYEKLAKGEKVCFTVTLLDGIVVAKSAFHSSMNYRSAVIFGITEAITGKEEKLYAARAITEKMIRGRWDDCRQPKDTELKSTGFIRIKIAEFSCKTREGGPIEDPEDLQLPYWSGVIPMSMAAGEPNVSDLDRNKIGTPAYIKNWRDS